jgi:hypothetical protein
MMKQFLALLLLAAPACTTAFVPPSKSIVTQLPSSTASTPQPQFTSTTLSERQWNFNNGRGPFGLKKNAEIWNGRVAQMAFVIVLLQELVTGKGVIASIQDGDALGLAGLGFAVVSIVGLTAFLVSKGDESDIVF